MGAPYGRKQMTELATEAGRDVNETLGRPREVAHQTINSTQPDSDEANSG